jgi:predicted nucleic acid-binding protein
VIFVDSNVPMYLVGGPHPHKADSQRLLESAIATGERLVTDVEVLQEILHRYVAINRRDAIQPAFDAVLDLVDEVFAVTLDDVGRAKDVVLGKTRLTARDALHAAVMERHEVRRIMSFDAAFDGVPGLERLGA